MKRKPITKKQALKIKEKLDYRLRNKNEYISTELLESKPNQFTMVVRLSEELSEKDKLPSKYCEIPLHTKIIGEIFLLGDNNFPA